jgi:hypothetical protein
VILLGCGGGHSGDVANGFVNHTRHPDSDLWAMWRAAQASLARQIDLNPVEQGAEATILPGDSRALQVNPSVLTVAPVPDVSSQALFASTGTERSDPTGMIACPQPCSVRYSTAYSRYQPALTRYAASWESNEASFRTILEYEFENHILFSLGYDMRWR